MGIEQLNSSGSSFSFLERVDTVAAGHGSKKQSDSDIPERICSFD